MNNKFMSSNQLRRSSLTKCKKRSISKQWTTRPAKSCNSKQSSQKRRKKWLSKRTNATRSLSMSRTRTIRFSSYCLKSLGWSRREERLTRLSKLCNRGLKRLKLLLMSLRSFIKKSKWKGRRLERHSNENFEKSYKDLKTSINNLVDL